MSDTGSPDVFDAVRSALEKNSVRLCAVSIPTQCKAGLGARVEALVREGVTVWSTQGVSILNGGQDGVIVI